MLEGSAGDVFSGLANVGNDHARMSDGHFRHIDLIDDREGQLALHAVLDVKHSEEWNREVIRSLVLEDGRRARAIAEGAVMRLWHGARSFERYREEFGLGSMERRAA